MDLEVGCLTKVISFSWLCFHNSGLVREVLAINALYYALLVPLIVKLYCIPFVIAHLQNCFGIDLGFLVFIPLALVIPLAQFELLFPIRFPSLWSSLESDFPFCCVVSFAT